MTTTDPAPCAGGAARTMNGAAPAVESLASTLTLTLFPSATAAASATATGATPESVGTASLSAVQETCSAGGMHGPTVTAVGWSTSPGFADFWVTVRVSPG